MHYKLQVVTFNYLSLPLFVFITSKKDKLIMSQKGNEVSGNCLHVKSNVTQVRE